MTMAFLTAWTERFKVVAALIAALTGILGAAWGSYQFVEARYAQADDVRLIGMRLDQKILADRRWQVQQQVWRIEEKCGGPGAQKCDQVLREQYKTLVDELRKLDQELGVIQKSYHDLRGK